MDEAKLRLDVLKPLFEKMGFKDVFHHHGGAGEQGKDFVMWDTGKLGERVNYAVVVKADRITGAVEANKGGAGTVSTQIQQAFGSEFRDAKTTEMQRVNECWVVSSHDISKEAKESIGNVLKVSNLDRGVRFIDGDELWRLVSTHFPQSLAFDTLAKVSEIFESLDKDWRIAVSTSGGENNFKLEPKSPSSKPLEFRLRLKLPEDATGEAKRLEIQSAVEKGTSVTFEAGHIENLEGPEFLRPIFDNVARIEFGGTPSSQPFDVSLQIDSDDGTKYRQQSITLRLLRRGTKEAVLSNSDQSVPWQVQFTLDLERRLAMFHWGVVLKGSNVHRLFDAARLWQAISKPGHITFKIVDTGMTFLKQRTEAAQPKIEPPEPGLLALLEDLDFIQCSTGQEIFLPDRTIRAEEVFHVAWIAKLVREGRASLKPTWITQGFDRETAEAFATQMGENPAGPLSILSERHFETLFEQRIFVPCAVFLEQARITRQVMDELKASLDNQAATDFRIKFEPVENSRVEMFYLQSLSTLDDLPEPLRKALSEHKQLQMPTVG